MSELFRQGDWCLVQDMVREIRVDGQTIGRHLGEVFIGHYCNGEEWRVRCSIPQRRKCHNCGEPVPETIIGFKQLVCWDR